MADMVLTANREADINLRTVGDLGLYQGVTVLPDFQSNYTGEAIGQQMDNMTMINQMDEPGLDFNDTQANQSFGRMMTFFTGYEIQRLIQPAFYGYVLSFIIALPVSMSINSVLRYLSANILVTCHIFCRFI